MDFHGPTEVISRGLGDNWELGYGLIWLYDRSAVRGYRQTYLILLVRLMMNIRLSHVMAFFGFTA